MAPDAGAGGTDSQSVRVYLGDDDHPGDAPSVPVDPTASFFWGDDSSWLGWHLGSWFLTADRLEDAYSRQLDPPRDGGTWARGARGEGRATGVVLWAQLDHPANRAVDVAACDALTFWARLDGLGGQLTVTLNDGTQASGSLEGRSTLPSRTLPLGRDWQEITLPLESFGLDRRSLASIEFFAGEAGGPFDLWIDDLALLCRVSP